MVFKALERKLPENITVPVGAKAIPLTKGYYAIVDEEDYEMASTYMWLAKNSPNNYKYAVATKCVGQVTFSLYLHRMVIGAKKGDIVDHINGNPLDNRKCNLRICTQAENCRNRRPQSKTKGVHFAKRNQKWAAYIGINYKKIWLGYYDTEIEASIAYNEAAEKYFGDFAKLNDVGEASKAKVKSVLNSHLAKTAKINCKVCGNSFKKHHTSHVFCSRSCKSIHYRRGGR